MNLYFTFDYELFVNDHPGDIDNCLITPTNELMKMFDRNGVKVTFFIDMAYVYRLVELKSTIPLLTVDYDKLCAQVKDIHKHGHEIALHIHPQWFYAQHDGQNWIMDFDHYKLSDMPLEEANIKFDACVKMLKEMTGCEILSFRAGGFSIQEYEGFYDAMKRNGIRNDSSVLFGEKQITHLHSYDYSSLKTPVAYRFSTQMLNHDENGCFTEYPISTKKISLLVYCFSRLKWKYLNNPEYTPWGNGGDDPERKKAEFKENVKRRFSEGVRIFANADSQLSKFLPDIYNEYKKKGFEDFVVLGHPKLASVASIRNIDKFITKYKNEVTFKII